jgi:prevent-host-death family protein
VERTITATEARVHFGELMRQIADSGETIIVERGGKPVVAVLSIDDYRRLQCDAGERDRARERLREFHEELRKELAGRTLPPAEDVIREGRDERDEQIHASVR